MNNGKTFSGYEWFSVLNERDIPEKITGTEAQQDVYTMVVAAMEKDPGVAQQILDLYTGDPEYKTLLLTGIYGLPDISLKALNRTPPVIGGIREELLMVPFKDARGKDTGTRPGMVISAEDFKAMFKDLWGKYRKQGELKKKSEKSDKVVDMTLGEHIVKEHAFNTLISVIGFTILQHDQIKLLPGKTFTMNIAGTNVALSETGAGRHGQSWEKVRKLYDVVRATSNPAMFDNVLGNLKAKMQARFKIFEVQKDLDSEAAEKEEITAVVEYVMMSLDELNFGEGGKPGLSDRGALYLYHVLTFPLVEAEMHIYRSEKAAIDKIVKKYVVASDVTLKSKISEKLQDRYPSIRNITGEDDSAEHNILTTTSPDTLWRKADDGIDISKESNSHIFSKVDQTQKHKTWRQVNETDTSRYMD
jgi:hypothetical protein